jgi:hypothetical protein
MLVRLLFSQSSLFLRQPAKLKVFLALFLHWMLAQTLHDSPLKKDYRFFSRKQNNLL